MYHRREQHDTTRLVGSTQRYWDQIEQGRDAESNLDVRHDEGVFYGMSDCWGHNYTLPARLEEEQADAKVRTLLALRWPSASVWTRFRYKLDDDASR